MKGSTTLWARAGLLGALVLLGAGAVRWGGRGLAGHASGDSSGGCGGASDSYSTAPTNGAEGGTGSSGIAAVTITHLQIQTPLKDPATGDPELALNYPVDAGIRLHVTWKDPAAAKVTRIPVVFAFGEQDGLGFCMIGAFVASTTGRNLSSDGSEDVDIASQRFFVTPQCLYDDHGVVDPTLRRTVNPILTIDPDGALGLTHDITYAPAYAKDPDVMACDGNTTNTTADSCVQDYIMTGSRGIDLEIAKLTLQSSVVVLDSCTPPASGLSAGDDAGAPAPGQGGASCESALVQDGNGNWVQAAPDILANLTVWLYGAADRVGGNRVDGLGGKPERFTYSFRPAQSKDDADWAPLFLHAKAKPRVGGHRQPPATIDSHQETSQVAMTPKMLHQGLYIEDDCAGSNDPGCNPAVHPRTDVLTGRWKDDTHFVARACVTSDAEGGDTRHENNCKRVGFRVVRTPRASGKVATQAALHTMNSSSSSFSFNKSWSDNQGDSSSLQLSEAFSTANTLDTSGATSNNTGTISVSSALFSNFDIVNAWADAQALVAISGSNYDYGIKIFGDQVFGDSATADNLAYSNDKLSWSKDVPTTFSYWVLSVELDFSGTIGLPIGLTMSAVSGAGLGYPAATEVGQVVASVTPTAKFDVTGSANVDLVIYEAGLEGTLDLIDMSVPITATTTWGLETLTSMDIQAQGEIDLDLSTMSGDIDLYAKEYEIDWCKKWHIPYPCGHSWDVFWTYTIASFSGWKWDETIWKQNLLSETLSF